MNDVIGIDKYIDVSPGVLSTGIANSGNHTLFFPDDTATSLKGNIGSGIG